MAKDHRGYLQRLSQIYTFWGLLPTTWQTAAVGAASAVTAYLGFQAGGLFYAVLGGVFVFTVGMIGLFFTLLVLRQVGVFGRLAIRDIGISSFAAEVQGNFLKELKFLTMNFTVQNNSARDIHFRCIRAHLSIMNQVNQDATSPEMDNIVPAGQPQSLLLATINSIKFAKIDLSRPSASPITGKFELDIIYGPNESMPYSLSYEAALSFGVSTSRLAKGKLEVHLRPVAMIKRYSHKQGSGHEQR